MNVKTIVTQFIFRTIAFHNNLFINNKKINLDNGAETGGSINTNCIFYRWTR